MCIRDSSRRARAKQVLALDGERSMIQQTVDRLKPLATLNQTWILSLIHI